MSRIRTPAALEPYMTLPEHSLTLVTGTLACNASWLTARLASEQTIVSWTRDEKSWREQLRNVKFIQGEEFDWKLGGVVILDHPEIMLATEQITIEELNRRIIRLRSQSTVIISCAADMLSHDTPLEMSVTSFIVQQAHMASRILSCRELKTGYARDVSGVLRITAGGAPTDSLPGLECRYLVQRDGNVKLVE